MKNLIIAAAVFAAAVPAVAQNININLGQPGYYGPITVSGYPAPQLFNPQPVIVERQRYMGQPVYLRVPPGHMKHWDKHCREYNACGQQVYFVRDEWYNQTYAPRYASQHPRYVQQQPRYVQQQPRYVEQRRENDDRDGDHGHGKGHDKHDKHGDDDNGHDNGHGNGHGHGRDHGD